MNKKEAINIIQECCNKYHEKLENKNFLFIYKNKNYFCTLETTFLKRNFLHLTGIKIDSKYIKSSTHFYKMCLSHKLSEKYFQFSEDGTTKLKLQILSQVIDIPYYAKMIGNYFDSKKILSTEKLVGNINLCLGFKQDRTGFYVPNTVLKENIKRVTISQNKIIAILEKSITDKKYTKITYMNKNSNINEILVKLNGLNIEIHLLK